MNLWPSSLQHLILYPHFFFFFLAFITPNCCFCSVVKSCPTHCDRMDFSMPDSSALHYLLEFVHIHVHWVSDAICYQPPHPLPHPSPFALSVSQNQGLFQQLSSITKLIWNTLIISDWYFHTRHTSRFIFFYFVGSYLITLFSLRLS